MTEHHDEGPCQRLVTKHYKALSRCIQNTEDPVERRTFIAFVVTNLILENCDEIEGLGMLEMVKNVLNHLKEDIGNASSVNHAMFYI